MIEDLIICELFIIGIYISTRKGMIFGFLTRRLEHYLYKLDLEFRILNLSRKQAWKDLQKTKDDESITNFNRVFKKESKSKRKVKIVFWLMSPFVICMVCMSSVFGSLYFLIQMMSGFGDYIVFIFALAGLSWISGTIIPKQNE